MNAFVKFNHLYQDVCRRIAMRWDAEPKALPGPTLEDRIAVQINGLKEAFSVQSKDIDNVIGMARRANEHVEHLSRKNAQVDAHYVSTMAKAFDEKHQAFINKAEAHQVAFQNHFGNILKDIEKACEDRVVALEATILDLRQEVAATGEHLRRALNKLRSIGEGN